MKKSYTPVYCKEYMEENIVLLLILRFENEVIAILENMYCKDIS